uniref:Pentacotripeptide-repeat region of PRORP domain-containing protein n=1 Tax=Manihot esculenta TaxID=3983 RepID=A0A2C9UHB7_MANES
MESSLQLHGFSLTPHLLHQTLLRLCHHSKIALSLFQYALSIPSSSSIVTSATYNIMIDILAKVHQFDVSWQLIVQMEQTNVQPTSHTFLILIRRLIAAGLTRKIFTHFCFLLDTLCKYGYVKVAVEIFNKRKSTFCPSVRMYTVLICGWCKIGRIDMAERFLREIDERRIGPNVVTYNVLLDGICRRARSHPEDRFERTIMSAEKVFDEMYQRGNESGVTSFSILLHLTLDKLRLMQEKGICLTVATYTSVVKSLCSCGRIENAEELLNEKVRNGISPNATSYNCFFKEYRGRKDAESAMKLYRKMREDNLCVLSTHTYNILLGIFMKMNRMNIVNDIWNDLCASGTGPDLDSYTMLIHGLCEKQKWKERRLKKKLDEESIAFGSEFQNYHLKPYRR